jgi:ABC-type nitrate/sulfonate/bicarbonate transport system ATPase subunit
MTDDATRTGATVAAPGSVHSVPRISVRNVEKRFALGGRRDGTIVALDDVSVDVHEGEFLAIIGPSGCGKTTLLRMIASLTPSNAGEIQVDGKVVVEPGPERAMVFQHFGLFPWKTVIENVKFPLRIRQVPDNEATEMARVQLRKVGLAETFEDSHPHQLSGGMRQRVGLARALATEAEILLMDEPFGAIDAQTRELLQNDLSRLCSEDRKTVVLVTHDIDEAVLLADRILILTAGPGRVREIVDVDLPTPRWKHETRTDPRFASIRAHVWDVIRSQIREAQDR